MVFVLFGKPNGCCTPSHRDRDTYAIIAQAPYRGGKNTRDLWCVTVSLAIGGGQNKFLMRSIDSFSRNPAPTHFNWSGVRRR